MRNFPRFTEKEIDYIQTLVAKSPTETTLNTTCKGVRDFTPFKNELYNKLTKYENIIKERKR